MKMENREIKLYLLRHGETVWNKQKKIQGQLNSPLTEEGIEKLKKTAETLERTDFQGVYTSHMERTVETAGIILDKNRKNLEKPVKIEKMRELNEIHFGIWQGKTYEEIKKEYPQEYDNYFNSPDKYRARVIGGEDLSEGLERFLGGMEKIVSFEKTRSGSGKILIITHGTVLELFINYVKNRRMDNLDERKLIGNGEYKIFSYDKKVFLLVNCNIKCDIF